MAGPQQQPTLIKDLELVTAMVARGRSVDVPFGEPIIAGTTEDGKEVKRLRCKTHGPGEAVKLPKAEVISLRRSGYLVDPDAAPAAIGDGPRFDSKDGAQVSA